MPEGVHRRKQPRVHLPPAPFIRVAGRIISAEVEVHPNPEEIDHVWIRIDVGEEIFISVNTSSKKNRLAGFDPRIRVGVIRGEWTALPARGVEVSGPSAYEELEARANVFFEHYDRGPLEDLLMDRCGEACLLEAWGAPYHQRVQGIHQVHCRRSSCAVPEDIHGRDGALKFYFENGKRTEQFLFKFCGQP